MVAGSGAAAPARRSRPLVARPSGESGCAGRERSNRAHGGRESPAPAQIPPAHRDSLGGRIRPSADLETTAVAIRVAALAELPLSDLDALSDLLGRCEDPTLGLRPRPDAATTAAGALWGGLVVARALGARIQYPGAVAKNLALLQRSDGGIGARHRAISTLRDTWRGLEAATLLDQPKEETR